MYLYLQKFICTFLCGFAFAPTYFHLQTCISFEKMYLYLHKCICICIFKNVFVFAQMYVCLPASAWGRLFPKQRSCPSSPFDVIIVNILYKHYIINDHSIIHIHTNTIHTNTSDIFKSDNLRQAWKKGRPDYHHPRFLQNPHKQKMQKCAILRLHAFLCVIVDAEMQMLSLLDKDRSGGLLCGKGTKELVKGRNLAPFLAFPWVT